MRVLRQKLLISLASLLIGFVLIELGYRGWRALAGDAYHAAAARAELLAGASRLLEPMGAPNRSKGELDQEAARSLATLVVHPYTGVAATDSNDLILRAMQLGRKSRGVNDYVVLVLGGSVAAQFFPDGSDALREKLAADPRFQGKRISILDQALVGGKEPQQVMMAAWLFSLDVRPDVVINLDGYNETALFSYNVEVGAHPVFPFFAQWGHVANSQHDDPKTIETMFAIHAARQAGWRDARRTLAWHLEESAVLGTLSTRHTRRTIATVSRAYEEYVASIGVAGQNASILGPRHPTDPAALQRMMVRCWVESSLSLQGMCAERGILYLHVLQPTLHDRGSKPLTAEELASSTLDPVLAQGVTTGYPALREAGKELTANGVHFVDASYVFSQVTEPLYYDFCHFRSSGSRILAAKIAESLLASLGDGDRRGTPPASK